MSDEEDGDEYEAIPGKLHLRQGGSVKTKKEKKKKKKDKKKKAKKRSREDSPDDDRGSRGVGGPEVEAPLIPVKQMSMTASERKFLEQKKKREEETLKKVALKSHRERVAEFNDRLSTLTEHFDLPRIGPG